MGIEDGGGVGVRGAEGVGEAVEASEKEAWGVAVEESGEDSVALLLPVKVTQAVTVGLERVEGVETGEEEECAVGVRKGEAEVLRSALKVAASCREGEGDSVGTWPVAVGEALGSRVLETMGEDVAVDASSPVREGWMDRVWLELPDAQEDTKGEKEGEGEILEVLLGMGAVTEGLRDVRGDAEADALAREEGE